MLGYDLTFLTYRLPNFGEIGHVILVKEKKLSVTLSMGCYLEYTCAVRFSLHIYGSRREWERILNFEFTDSWPKIHAKR